MDHWSRRQVVQGVGAAGLGLVAGCGRLPWQTPPAPRVYRLGYLAVGNTPQFDDASRRGLLDLGYVEGVNLVTESRVARGQSFEEVAEAATTQAAELASIPVDVLAAGLGYSVRAALAATTTIPIVMVTSGDPVATGVVDSYARPGGNLTGQGMLSSELAGKRLQLLKETLPSLSRAAALMEPSGDNAFEFQATQSAAEQLGVELLPLEVHDGNSFESAFAALVRQRTEGLVIFTHGFARRFRTQIIAAASTQRLPVMYGDQQYVADGGCSRMGQIGPVLSIEQPLTWTRSSGGPSPLTCRWSCPASSSS